MKLLARGWMLWLSLTLPFVAAIVTYALGYHRAAALVANLGVAVVLFLMIFVVAIFDPSKKWPNRSFKERLVLVLTFGRADPPR